MKKVLIKMRDLRHGSGVVSCIMNYYPQILNAGYQVDFLIERFVESAFSDLVKKAGGKIWVLPKDTGKPSLRNAVFVKRVLDNGYDIVHVNTTGINALMVLFQAKRVGVNTRIYHAHAPIYRRALKNMLRWLLYEHPSVICANRYAACSDSVGKSVFGNRNYIKVINAFDVERYRFDEKARTELRAELKLDGDALVIGAVGRLSDEKQPLFAVDIFTQIHMRVPNSKLLWIGDGMLKEKLETYVDEKDMAEHCIFLGARSDVNLLYSAMDVFLLPSKFEGLGLVFVEAQAAGLMCYGSDTVPPDVDISGKMHHISLDESAEEWACRIVEDIRNLGNRGDNTEIVKKAGFDINSSSAVVKLMYQ